jgi:hypothetical protein
MSRRARRATSSSSSRWGRSPSRTSGRAVPLICGGCFDRDSPMPRRFLSRNIEEHGNGTPGTPARATPPRSCSDPSVREQGGSVLFVQSVPLLGRLSVVVVARGCVLSGRLCHFLAFLACHGSIRVRGEIMGSQYCRIVGKSQPVLVMIGRRLLW